MGLDVDRVPITGTWVRHLPAGGDPLYRPAEPGDFRWQRGAMVEGLYLAADEATMWAEWYRWLAEARRSPRSALPRDLWRFQARLERVAEVTSTEALARVGLPAPTPSRAQWPAYQAVGERLFAEGWQGVRYASAARPQGRALCVFRTRPRDRRRDPACTAGAPRRSATGAHRPPHVSPAIGGRGWVAMRAASRSGATALLALGGPRSSVEARASGDDGSEANRCDRVASG